jgi:hypothetical protein
MAMKFRRESRNLFDNPLNLSGNRLNLYANRRRQLTPQFCPVGSLSSKKSPSHSLGNCQLFQLMLFSLFHVPQWKVKCDSLHKWVEKEKGFSFQH